ncbi:hypothetical protein I3J27_10045 [Bradyrhizobium xenonodulans]|uniref:Uncharacterized protein n=1 Tax=Bradyrhizobium xenonodulans TaxID=2736875 RepID=A0ABY7MQS6_9BRAD|nr:hypothetical protein [Bradyrhizobium xenonodulans]WBL80737.1 hypothetical protein I3J27_10045 [Bradyrhizobium xenonodulans]
MGATLVPRLRTLQEDPPQVKRDVAFGSWLCENGKTVESDRTSYSSEADLTLMLASDFKLDDELKNMILAVFRLLAFLHSQGHELTKRRTARQVAYGPEPEKQISGSMMLNDAQ